MVFRRDSRLAISADDHLPAGVGLAGKGAAVGKGPTLPAIPPRRPRQADTDEQLIALWLHGRGPKTREAYEIHLRRFLAFVRSKPLQQVTLADLQAFQDSLGHYAPASRATILSVVKSLLSFAHDVGYVTFNPGRAMLARITRRRSQLETLRPVKRPWTC